MRIKKREARFYNLNLNFYLRSSAQICVPIFYTLTIAEALHAAENKLMLSGVPDARLDAELLLRHVLKQTRAWVFTHCRDALDEQDRSVFNKLILRRTTREPVQHIIGKQEFWGLEFIVTQSVLIPRPETELVVESALKKMRDSTSPLLVDLCTGSGCIAISLAKELRKARVFATDKSDRALIVARENARAHGVSNRIRFFEGDLFGPLDELDIHGNVDVITANPPYIKSLDLKTLQPEVRDFEPELALIAGPEGTELAERIIRTAPRYLKQGGSLIMEMGMGQAQALSRIILDAGVYESPVVLKDLAGIERVIAAKKQ